MYITCNRKLFVAALPRLPGQYPLRSIPSMNPTSESCLTNPTLASDLEK